MALITFAAFTACGTARQADTGITENAGPGNIDNTPSVGENDKAASDAGYTEDKNTDGSEDESGKKDAEIVREDDQKTGGQRVLLQSASVDLDNDGENEQIEAIRLELPAGASDTAGGIEGRLVITDGDIEKQIVFWGKDDYWTGILTSIQFEDLDGDGAKDVFIVIPGYGASFNYSNYFMYSYRKDRSYAFSNDNTLADFIGSFEFSYANGNKLKLTSEQHGFTTELSIEDAADRAQGEKTQMEEFMRSYAESTWIDPVCVDISGDSRLALVKINSRPEIKVPLPVFGMATVNMIAEIDLYYHVNDNFEPVLKRCEVIDFSGERRIKAGSFELN